MVIIVCTRGYKRSNCVFPGANALIFGVLNLGVVNAYQGVPKSQTPTRRLIFLFDRMLYRNVFPVFPAQKRTVWVISTLCVGRAALRLHQVSTSIGV